MLKAQYHLQQESRTPYFSLYTPDKKPIGDKSGDRAGQDIGSAWTEVCGYTAPSTKFICLRLHFPDVWDIFLLLCIASHPISTIDSETACIGCCYFDFTFASRKKKKKSSILYYVKVEWRHLSTHLKNIVHFLYDISYIYVCWRRQNFILKWPFDI